MLPLVGDGFEGAGGGPLGLPAVVKDRVLEGAMSAGFTSVAKVLDTTLQK
jgi:hypothetical protein